MNVNAKRVWRSLRDGFVLTSLVYFLVSFIEVFATDEPVRPLLERFPLAWITYWPKLLYDRSQAVTDRDLFICLTVTTAAYATILYGIAYFRDKSQ